MEVVSARVPKELRQQTDLLATLRGCNRQEVVREALRQEIEQAPEYPKVLQLQEIFQGGAAEK
jgi:metal-responsive CopG/Arc/MetJ family transcriptional regulator